MIGMGGEKGGGGLEGGLGWRGVEGGGVGGLVVMGLSYLGVFAANLPEEIKR